MGSDEQSGDAFKGVAQLLANFFKVSVHHHHYMSCNISLKAKSVDITEIVMKVLIDLGSVLSSKRKTPGSNQF